MPGFWGIRIAAAVYILFCLYVGWQALDFPAGGGTFPLFAEVSAVLVSGILIAQSFRRAARDNDVPLDFRITFARLKPLILLGMAILYVLLMFEIGYFVTTLLFLIAASLMTGIRDPKIIAITVIILIPAMYGFFVLFLHAPLPKGILF